ncbi:MAG: cysteine desulfurase family protein [Thermaurantimonas sp.]
MIYLDYASTTPLCKPAKEAMMQAMDVWGNPSSLHSQGRKAKVQLELSRRKIASLLEVLPAEINFTSGATESANWVFYMARKSGIKTVITSPIEHKATLEAIQHFTVGDNHVKYTHPKPDGNYNLQHIEELLASAEKPVLVALLWINNELGNITRISEISKICRTYDALLYIDGAQAIGKYQADFHQADFIAGSAHKFYGPKGTGFLFVNRRMQKKYPFIAGGGQERSLRGGTESTILVPGMAAALEYSMSQCSDMLRRFEHLSIQLMEHLQPLNVICNGPDVRSDYRYPGIVNISIPQEPDTGRLLFALDMAEVAVSAGSACNSGSLKPSHVISYLYPERAKAAHVRVSMGIDTTSEELRQFADILGRLIQYHN